jgi:hypothetical protein
VPGSQDRTRCGLDADSEVGDEGAPSVSVGMLSASVVSQRSVAYFQAL